MWEVLTAALGALAGAEGASEGQLPLPLKVDLDFTPLAVFSNGDWIGRVHSREGVERAFAPMRGNTVRKHLVRRSLIRFDGDCEWIFVYVQRGQAKSVMALSPDIGRHGHYQWDSLAEASVLYYPKVKYLPDDAQIRGAWIWWLYEVLNIGNWSLDDRWASRDQIPLLNRLRFPRVVVDELIPRIRNSDVAFHTLKKPSFRQISIYALSVFNRLMTRELGVVSAGIQHGVWSITSQADKLRFHRRFSVHSTTPLGTNLHLRWSPELHVWQLAYDEHFTEIFAQDGDLIDLLISADIIIADADFESWLDHRLVEGTLLYESEPYRLLDATEPAVMTTSAFARWIGRPVAEVK